MQKIETPVVETMLIPLWSRAVEQHQKNPVLIDTESERILNALGADLNYFSARRQRATQVGCCLRGLWFDRQLEACLAAGEKFQVIQLGAGLDDRYRRIQHKDKIAFWYDLDLPEGIQLRQQLVEPKEKVTLLSEDLMSESWMEKMAANDLPVIVLIEGVLMYFDEGQIKSLFEKMKKHFKSLQVIFDAMPHVAVGREKYHDSLKRLESDNAFKWGLRNPDELKTLLPDYELAAFSYMSDMPESKGRFPWLLSTICRFKVLKKRMMMHLCRVQLKA